MSWSMQCWICRQMMKGQEVPSEQTNPKELFQAIMEKNPSFGRHAVYMVWLQRAFPTEGKRIWQYLKRQFSQWQYSFA